jgi:outer membrane immunogenic protein
VTESLSQKLSWLGTVRARAGVTVTPTVLAYVTGGLAYGEVKTDFAIAGTNGVTPVAAAFGSSTTKAGWTVGVGLEGRIVGNWTGKIEYLYVDLGTVSGGPFISPVLALGGGFVATNFSSHVTDNILRAGINYKFGGYR